MQFWGGMGTNCVKMAGIFSVSSAQERPQEDPQELKDSSKAFQWCVMKHRTLRSSRAPKVSFFTVKYLCLSKFIRKSKTIRF